LPRVSDLPSSWIVLLVTCRTMQDAGQPGPGGRSSVLDGAPACPGGRSGAARQHAQALEAQLDGVRRALAGTRDRRDALSALVPAANLLLLLTCPRRERLRVALPRFLDERS